MKKILVNLKDWFNLEENIEFAKNIKGLNIILFPALAYLYIYKDIGVTLGAQDVSSFTSGAHTGSISATHLKELGIKCVILNHNELRIDDDAILYDKVIHTLETGLDIVICINDTNKRELERIKTIFSSVENTSKISIAYEPFTSLTVEEIKANLEIIKNELGSHEYAGLIYGGSVSKDNIDEYEKTLSVDGYLISRHALDIKELNYLIDIIHNQDY